MPYEATTCPCPCPCPARPGRPFPRTKRQAAPLPLAAPGPRSEASSGAPSRCPSEAAGGRIEHVLMVCQDDKRKIPIGEPYNPVSDGHNRQAPQFLNGPHGALDHTISKMSTTPSCNFFNTAPTSTADIPASSQGERPGPGPGAGVFELSDRFRSSTSRRCAVMQPGHDEPD